MTLNLPDNASLEDVKGVYYLEVLRRHQAEARAAKQIGINRSTFKRWLEKRGIILACVQDGPNVIPARQPKKARAARSIPPSAPPSKPGVKRAGLQSIADEAASIRAAHQRRRA